MRRSAFAALALLIAASPGPAVEKPKAAPTPTPSPTPSPVEPPPPYEPQLLRLAEIMGSLSYLRDLCHDGDGAQFRTRIARLIEVEPRTQERKDQIAGAFNKGFGDYQLTYRACTSNAREIIANYLEEVARISRDVASRYGG